MNKGLLLLRTLSHLRPRQVIYQILTRLHKPKFRNLESPETESLSLTAPIPREYCFDNEKTFTFLNISKVNPGWNDVSDGMLWAYNLNYMDYINQETYSFESSKILIDRFISEINTNKIGLDPYPIALRGINWIKWMSGNANRLTETERKVINDSLYSQYRLLSRKIEYHLLGNHLLEDAYSIVIGAIYFNDPDLWKTGCRILLTELDEQILADGAHYEQSPMYHCILLDRLLDVYNVSINNNRFGYNQRELDKKLKFKAVIMLGHLENIIWKDRTMPLLNDSAFGIAPKAEQIFDYAKRLGLKWQGIPLKECGYRKFINDRFEAIVDIGNITATYQPGHTHSDVLSFELRKDNKPWITDTGISTYNKTERRQYERSTKAHNTVTIGNNDAYEVWGGFRVGKRADVTVQKDLGNKVVASHDGYAPVIHTRNFEIRNDCFEITDTVTRNSSGVSRLHFAPDIKVDYDGGNKILTTAGEISLTGADKVLLYTELVSTEYNRFNQISVAEIYFSSPLTIKFT